MLSLYYGGFQSPQKRKLFAKLADSIRTGMGVYFWADIDLGGFQMFDQLHRCIPQLRPMRMSEEDVQAHYTSGLPRTDEYFERLSSCLQENRFSQFSGVIQLLLQYRVTIEQEVFLL